MEYVYFVYGLAFFLLGFAILLYPKKGSSFSLSKNIKYIAYFGILHGINEWLDLFIYIKAAENTNPLEIIRMATLPASFIFLTIFAAKVLKTCTKRPCCCRFITIFLIALWAILFFTGPRTMLTWDIWSRYILCLPGSFLAGLALLLHVPQIETVRLNKITSNLKLAGFAFIAYALVAGAIVPKTDFFPASIINYENFQIYIGVPVQIFRSFCAVVIAISITRVLGLFNWELKKDLHDSRLRFTTVASQIPVTLFTTDENLNISFIEGKGLEDLNLSSGQLQGKNILSVFDNDSSLEKSCKSALQNKESTITVNMNDKVLQIYCNPLVDRDLTVGLIGIAFDVTTELKNKAKLDEYREEMLRDKTLAELGTMGTEMVEKLSTPLASIRASLLTALAALRKIPNNANIRQPLENGLENSKQALEIIDRFFNFANIPANPKPEPIDIEQVFNRILAVFRGRINAAMLKIETTGLDLVTCMSIPSHELEQMFFTVFQNVLNAADGKKVSVFSIECVLSQNEIKFVFTDELNSIPYENPNNIFDLQLQQDTFANKNAFELIVLKRLLIAHNGNITAEKKENHTIVSITLPVEKIGE